MSPMSLWRLRRWRSSTDRPRIPFHITLNEELLKLLKLLNDIEEFMNLHKEIQNVLNFLEEFEDIQNLLEDLEEICYKSVVYSNVRR